MRKKLINACVICLIVSISQIAMGATAWAQTKHAKSSVPLLQLPADISTVGDGRLPITELYKAYTSLLKHGWKLDVVAHSKPHGTERALPIIALRSPQQGKAVWILAGIHGEEPAGPNAIAASIDAIAELGRQHAVVLMPLNNPQGYARNWRYLNMPVYSKDVEGHSVGDSAWLLDNPEKPGQPRTTVAPSAEAVAITLYVIKQARRYPPTLSIDLHEDNLLSEGYIYSQGFLGAQDPAAIAAVRILQAHGIPLKATGETRFGEPVSNGIVGPVVDDSIDELISAQKAVVDGKLQKGPGARSVLVFETPAGHMELKTRVAAHSALLRAIGKDLLP